MVSEQVVWLGLNLVEMRVAWKVLKMVVLMAVKWDNDWVV